MIMNYILIAFGLIVFIYLVAKYMGAGGGGNFTNISSADAKQLMKSSKVALLDVRSPNEIKQGKIKGAKEINIASAGFANTINKLDKSKTYLVYCRSGNRSRQACKIMESQGFEKLYNLKGGYMSW